MRRAPKCSQLAGTGNQEEHVYQQKAQTAQTDNETMNNVHGMMIFINVAVSELFDPCPPDIMI